MPLESHDNGTVNDVLAVRAEEETKKETNFDVPVMLQLVGRRKVNPSQPNSAVMDDQECVSTCTTNVSVTGLVREKPSQLAATYACTLSMEFEPTETVCLAMDPEFEAQIGSSSKVNVRNSSGKRNQQQVPVLRQQRKRGADSHDTCNSIASAGISSSSSLSSSTTTATTTTSAATPRSAVLYLSRGAYTSTCANEDLNTYPTGSTENNIDNDSKQSKTDTDNEKRNEKENDDINLRSEQLHCLEEQHSNDTSSAMTVTVLENTDDNRSSWINHPNKERPNVNHQKNRKKRKGESACTSIHMAMDKMPLQRTRNGTDSDGESDGRNDDDTGSAVGRMSTGTAAASRMMYCRVCRKRRRLDEFPPSASRNTRYHCRECDTARSRAYKLRCPMTTAWRSLVMRVQRKFPQERNQRLTFREHGEAVLERLQQEYKLTNQNWSSILCSYTLTFTRDSQLHKTWMKGAILKPGYVILRKKRRGK